MMKKLLIVFFLGYSFNVSAKNIRLGLCDDFPSDFYARNIDSLYIENGQGYCLSPVKLLDENVKNFGNLSYLYFWHSENGTLVKRDATDLLPAELAYLPNLRSIYTNAPNNEIYGMNQLEKLYLTFNSADCLREMHENGFSKLKNLRELGLSFSMHSKEDLVIEGIRDLPYLTKVFLYNPSQAILNEVLANPNIEEIEINNAYALNVDFSNAKGLKSVIIRACEITEIPSSIYELKKLEKLILARNKITSISPKLGNLSHLEYLDLTSNNLEDIPVEIGKCERLKYLYLSNNRGLYQFPDVFQDLRKLKHLSLSNCAFKALPPSLVYCSQLESFGAGHNQLTELQIDFSAMVNLKVVALNNNQLNALPTSLFSCGALENLSVENNQLTKLTEIISGLKNLKILNAHNNNLIALPADIGDLKALTRLSLYANELKALPNSIVKLKRLEDLYVGNNQLTEFPIGLKRLKKLRSLEIQSNPLAVFPKEIYKMRHLDRVWVSEVYAQLKGFKMSEENPIIIVTN